MKSIFSEDYKIVIERIKNYRLSKGLSQRELANYLGNTQSYVSKIENGQIRLDLIQTKNIAKALDVELQDLIS